MDMDGASLHFQGAPVYLSPCDCPAIAGPNPARARQRSRCQCGNWYTISKLSPREVCHTRRYTPRAPGGGAESFGPHRPISGGVEFQHDQPPMAGGGSSLHFQGAPVYLSPIDFPATVASKPERSRLRSRCPCGNWYTVSKVSPEGECPKCRYAHRPPDGGVGAIGSHRWLGRVAERHQDQSPIAGVSASIHFHGAPVYLSPIDFPAIAVPNPARARERSLCQCGNWYTISKLSPEGECPTCRQSHRPLDRGAEAISDPRPRNAGIEFEPDPPSIEGGVGSLSFHGAPAYLPPIDFRPNDGPPPRGRDLEKKRSRERSATYLIKNGRAIAALPTL